MKTLNLGTFNTQRCTKQVKQKQLCQDAFKYNLQILGITETAITKESKKKVKIKYGNKTEEYYMYHGGIEDENNNATGVGIIIQKDLEPTFKRITDRICKAELKLGKYKATIIVAYAPTQKRSDENPKEKEDFYEALEHTLEGVQKNKFVAVLGDLNAKTGSGYTEFSENMGKYGKGLINENGRTLLECCKRHNLILTNTLFMHKMAHRVTWTAPERKKEHLSYDGNIRRNPYRNQIDYILIRIEHKSLLTNARSYSGTITSSDHKLVKTSLRLEWTKLPKSINNNKCIDINKLEIDENKTEYKTQIKEQSKEINIHDTSNNIWTNICNICNTTAAKITGYVKHNERFENKELVELVERKQKIRKEIESNTNKEKRELLRKEKNKTANEIKDKIGELEDEKLNKDLEELERLKEDSTKYYHVMRKLQSKKKKKPLVIYDENKNIVANEKTIIELVTRHFTQLFTRTEKQENQTYKPAKLQSPFTKEEIIKSANKLKNNKSPGIDNLNAEMINHAPEEIPELIAHIYNKAAETEDYPEI